METIRFQNRQPEGVTVLSNLFIDRYMPEANGEFVKIYLYFLRLSTSGEARTFSEITDSLELTTKDVRRALNYWIKKGLLICSFNENKEPVEIIFVDPAAAVPVETGRKTASKAASTKASADPAPKQTAAPAQTPVSESDTRLPGERITALSADKGAKQILFIAEQYLQHTLSAREAEMLLYFYDRLHFSVDLLDYLLDYCVSHSHTNWRYIQKVGLNWDRDGIDTVEKAAARTQNFNQKRFTIMKAYGLGNRNPAPVESEMIDKWISELPISFDLVLEAVSRTMEQIHEPKFNYTDKILESWVKADVRSLNDLAALDREFEKKKKTRKAAEKPAASSASGFSNYSGRTYDGDELARKLVRLN